MGEQSTPRLRPPEHRVDPRAVAYWTVRAATGWLAVLAAEALWLVLDDATRATAHLWALAATTLAAALHSTVMPRWRYRVHRWESAPHALYTQTGWAVQDRRIAPLSRIQTIDSTRGPLEQLFRLTNVTVTTASAAGPLTIQGLGEETARRIVVELTERVRTTKDDAT
ncbi:PH domain-containing protein [Kitasatospora sp. NPDC101157]|uniref:PH domain-containing protein n=1 Tax=Kitasatospora sp. NPDC101157 TaxID=3364098 RepID=UPI003820A3B9